MEVLADLSHCLFGPLLLDVSNGAQNQRLRFHVQVAQTDFDGKLLAIPPACQHFQTIAQGTKPRMCNVACLPLDIAPFRATVAVPINQVLPDQLLLGVPEQLFSLALTRTILPSALIRTMASGAASRS